MSVDTTATLVPMTRAHVDELMVFEHEMFGSEAWSADAYRAEIGDTRTRHYLAAVDADGTLLGWGGVMVVSGAAEILTVGTVPAARRRGIAIQLVAGLVDEAQRRGATEMFLEVRVDNEAARTLYEREGFTEIARRRGYYDSGRVDAIVMRRELGKAVQDG